MNNNSICHVKRPLLIDQNLYLEFSQVDKISMCNWCLNIGRKPDAIQISAIGGAQIHNDNPVIYQLDRRMQARDAIGISIVRGKVHIRNNGLPFC